ncbi:M48 family metallopeptidase [uncultured Dokdonia sp.]|uniref:M48 family metallopeptidase n=1 Tax=uncultured Dokdonia sp. TaxID=575653 RepID=UPI002625F585|nr:M48 family metallopeptidase [uncultured Dokdonia sp.]
MTSQTLFYSIIAILVLSYLVDFIMGYLNAKHFNDPIPEALKDVYNEEEYLKSQAYKKTKDRFGTYTATFSLLLTLGFFFFDGFAIVDQWARTFTDHPIGVALIFFGAILFASDILTTPFSYYDTFVIEEKFGFNKMKPITFFMDKLKGWIMGIVIGGGLLALIIWIYEMTQNSFWLYAWGVVTLFSLFMNMFYARLIVPIFNKQAPLGAGELRSKIEMYATKVGFNLTNIFTIDGSKRSTKANAYFSGLGREKRITLYDTLINDLDDTEIVAVLAHEVGHYKRKHIITNLLLSVVITGVTLWLFSLCLAQPIIAEAVGVSIPSFHVGMVVFGILYSPISAITGFFMSALSRKHEYEADNYAAETYEAEPLISSLKKLSKNSLSNLTPHPLYVALHYSHPTLLQRVENLKRHSVV